MYMHVHIQMYMYTVHVVYMELHVHCTCTCMTLYNACIVSTLLLFIVRASKVSVCDSEIQYTFYNVHVHLAHRPSSQGRASRCLVLCGFVKF